MNEKNMKTDRVIVICPNLECQQKLSLPIVHKPLEVTCPECHTVFSYNYDAFQKVSRVFTKIKPEEKLKWYYRRWVVILSLILFPPIGIGLIWGGSKFKLSIKILFTIIFGYLIVVWNYSEGGIIRLIALAIPVGIILLWAKSKLRRPVKVWFTVIFISLALVSNWYTKFVLEKEIGLPLLTNGALINELDRKISKESVGTEKIKTVPQIVKSQGRSIVFIETDKGIQGSGFIISQNGVIVTNRHVLEGAHSAQVTLPDGNVYDDVSLVAADRERDLALIKIVASNLPVLNLGDSDKVEVGEHVIAIGNPRGWKSTVSDGLLSAIRDFKGIKLLQTSAPISPGSSGGPLLNMHGEVIGITSSLDMWGQNLNFAIPVNEVKSLIKTESTFIKLLKSFPDLSTKKELEKGISVIEKYLQEEKIEK